MLYQLSYSRVSSRKETPFFGKKQKSTPKNLYILPEPLKFVGTITIQIAMEKKIIQKMAACHVNGKLDIIPETAKELREQTREELAQLPAGEQRWKQMLLLAHRYAKNGDEREAYNYFRHVLMQTAWEHRDSSIREIAEEAFWGLSALSSTRDECLWEECSQIVGDLLPLFEKHE